MSLRDTIGDDMGEIETHLHSNGMQYQQHSQSLPRKEGQRRVRPLGHDKTLTAADFKNIFFLLTICLYCMKQREGNAEGMLRL